MPEVEASVRLWQGGNERGLNEAWCLIKDRHERTVKGILRAFQMDPDRRDDLSLSALTQALEELDLMILEGQFLTSEYLLMVADLCNPPGLLDVLASEESPEIDSIRRLISSQLMRQIVHQDRNRLRAKLLHDVVDALNDYLRDPGRQGLGYAEKRAVIESRRRALERELPHLIATATVPAARVQGLLTARLLGERATFEWRGENEFYGLSLGIWKQRARSLVKAELRHQYEDDEDAVYQLESKITGPEGHALGREGVAAVIDSLFQAREDFSRSKPRRPGLVKILEATLRYLVRKLWDAVPAANRERVANARNLETLLSEADLGAFHPDGKEWRVFILEDLGLKRAAMDKALTWERFLELLLPFLKDAEVDFE